MSHSFSALKAPIVIIMATWLAASAAGADSKLHIHNNTDTVLSAQVRMGTPRLSTEHLKFPPQRSGYG